MNSALKRVEFFFDYDHTLGFVSLPAYREIFV